LASMRMQPWHPCACSLGIHAHAATASRLAPASDTASSLTQMLACPALHRRLALPLQTSDCQSAMEHNQNQHAIRQERAQLMVYTIASNATDSYSHPI
jgi:hypothetical protein